MNPLNLLLSSPILAIIYLLMFCRNSSVNTLRTVGITIASGIFVLTLYTLRQFVLYGKTFYFFKPIGIFQYNIEINGISMLFLLLTSFIILVCILSSRYSIQTRVKEYLIHFFLLQFAVFGVFLSRDIVMFYIFFELTLVPMFFIIGIWGGANRIYSTFKLFLYTFTGSVLFLIAIVYLIITYKTTSILQLVYSLSPETGIPLPISVEKILWLLCFVGFAIKVPMVPFHTWLPNAHVEAPTSGSVVLAGILIKLGGYAMLTILLPLFPNASMYFQDFVIIISIVAVIYASIVAMGQEDIKKMIAYSSIAHMGYVTIGIFTFSQDGISSAIFQMLSHGFVSGALFLSIGVIYERLHTRQFSAFGGIARKMPNFAFAFMILTMASVGLPGTSGFVGEMMAIIAVFNVSPIYGILTASGMVLGAGYMLVMYKRTMFGEITNPEVNTMKDLYKTERVTLWLSCAFCLFLGIYPKAVLEIIPIFNTVAFR
jgi:NADH-quinone oxidoreductase subunit M